MKSTARVDVSAPVWPITRAKAPYREMVLIQIRNRGNVVWAFLEGSSHHFFSIPGNVEEGFASSIAKVWGVPLELMPLN